MACWRRPLLEVAVLKGERRESVAAGLGRWWRRARLEAALIEEGAT
jgi:hypothetical protein